MSAFNFIIKSKIYDREVYNVLSDNLTVNDIILYIRSYIDDITIEYVDSKIMNQLSYEVSKKRIEGKGLNFEGKIEQSISETIRLLEKAGQRP